RPEASSRLYSFARSSRIFSSIGFALLLTRARPTAWRPGYPARLQDTEVAPSQQEIRPRSAGPVTSVGTYSCGIISCRRRVFGPSHRQESTREGECVS